MCVCVCVCGVASDAGLTEEARMRSIPLSQFEEHVAQMHQDRDKGFELEYQVMNHSPPLSSPPSLYSSPCVVAGSHRRSAVIQLPPVRLLKTQRTRTRTDLPTSFPVSAFHWEHIQLPSTCCHPLMAESQTITTTTSN